MVISLFCTDKYMFFKKGGRMCYMKLQHGSIVILNKLGGGVTGDIKHMVCGNDLGWFIAIELEA